MREYKILPAGDTALIVEFGEGIDRRLSRLVLALDRRLNEAKIKGSIDGVVETARLNPVARLGGPADYSALGEVFKMTRPTS